MVLKLQGGDFHCQGLLELHRVDCGQLGCPHRALGRSAKVWVVSRADYELPGLVRLHGELSNLLKISGQGGF